MGALVDKDLARTRFVAQPRGQVYDGAERAVVAPTLESDHADVGEAERDADAQPDVVTAWTPPVEQRLHRPLNLARHGDRHERRIRTRQRIIQERHQSVAR